MQGKPLYSFALKIKIYFVIYFKDLKKYFIL